MNITLPQITAVISILFMIRFIWNFNKFEDIFLLTGGASGTRTLPINVYEQGFSIGDIGMGSAVSMVIVLFLLFFMLFYFKLIGKRAYESLINYHFQYNFFVFFIFSNFYLENTIYVSRI